MNMQDIRTLEEVLFELPPQLKRAIEIALMSSDQVGQMSGQSTNQILDNIDNVVIKNAVKTFNFIFPPYVILCLIICLITYFSVQIYREYRVSQRPKLKNQGYSPIGTYILSYCHNYDKINSGEMKFDIDDIYSRCLKKYEYNELLQQRKEEILSDRKKTRIINHSKAAVFIILLLIFIMLGMGGMYIGLEIKGLALALTACYVAKQWAPFFFPYKTDSYEILQVKEFRNIVETYELEKIENLKK